MHARLQALLAALWGGFLLCVAFVAAPSAFAALERAQAGLYVARLFAMEAQISLAVGIVLILLERRLSRDRLEAGGAPRAMSARLLLPALALFFTIAGYYGLQPMMAQARAGSGSLSFGALHGISLACFGAKGLAVLALAWITQRRAS